MTTGPVDADTYTCTAPDCTHLWYRPDLGWPVPTCPTHHTKLTRKRG